MIDMEIAIGLDRDIDARMPGQQIEHMVEEADTGRYLGYARAIEVYRNLNVGLLGLALDGRCAHEIDFSLPLAENAALLTGRSLLRYRDHA